MTKQEALQKIEEAESNIKELKEFIEQEDNKPWKPIIEERYYYIGNDSKARSTLNFESYFDKDRINSSNCFKTEEQAKKSFKYWAMNESEYEYSFPFAPDTWFDDYEGCELWNGSLRDWEETVDESSVKESLIYRRKRK